MIINRQCTICDNFFDIEIDEKTHKILTKCFYMGKIRLGIGNWSSSEWVGFDKEKGILILKKCHPWYRELKYRLIDFKRLIFHQYKDVEYWECGKCLKRKYLYEKLN